MTHSEGIQARNEANMTGWLCKVKVTDNYESEMGELLDEAAYKAHCEGEEH
jgi:glycine cleavage system H lipoate-binding protein